MRKLLAASLIALIAAPVFAAEAPKTDEEKTLYTIGVYQARQLGFFQLTPKEFEMVQQGFAGAAPGKEPAVNMEEYGKKVQEFAQARRAQQMKKLAAGNEFLEKAAAAKGAVKTESGLVFLSQREGTGPAPTATDTVKIHYRGTLIDGKEFDNTSWRKQPAEFKLDGVIKCWTEGIQMMKAGGRAKLYCPPQLAYGSKGVDSVIPPDATLVFEVELLDVKK